MAAESKGFGALFAEKKNALDHFQAKMASILPSMPGMPVAKYYDLAIGVDFHETIWPPSPLLPIPHVGMVFDIMGAIMSAIASVLPAPTEETASDEDVGVRMVSVMAAVVHAMKPTVQVHGQWVANAGAGIQHLPGVVLHPIPVVKPMASSEMWMGSSTVLADGGPCSTQFHPALSCNLVGFPSLPRLNKLPKAKIALMAPTSMLVVITSGGKPVLVGGPPTIDLFQLMFKLALKGLGKAWKKARGKGKAPHTKNPKLGDAQPNSKKCSKGEPVDMATGCVHSTNTDFELPGPIPFVWQRTYYSNAEVNGPLGYNWHHNYNMGMYEMGNGFFTVRLSDGRETVLPVLAPGEIFFNRKEQLLWQNNEEGYTLTDASKLVYRFRGPKNPDGYSMLSSITNQSGFDITFNYNDRGFLHQIKDSSNRLLQVENDELGHILRIHVLANGQLIKLVQYAYDVAGNMVQTEDAGGAKKYFYYNDHLLIKLTNQSGMSFYWEYEGKADDAKCIHTWGDGGVLEYWTKYEDGKTTTRNGLGHTSEYYYDERKLIYKIIDENGGITHQVYNDFEELAVAINPEGGSVQYHYNNYGKITRLINENQEATLYNYDDRLNLVSVTSPGGMHIRWEYDENNRIKERTGADGNTIYYTYKEKYLKLINDKKNRTYELEYDRQHNLIQLVYPNDVRQSWKYDDLGRILSFTDVRNNITLYRYDDLGNVTWLKEPDGNEHFFNYDASGNLIKAKDSSHEVDFDYGPLGILKGRTQDGTSVRFKYDTELQLRSIANEGGEVYRFGLDGMGNVVNEWGFDGMHRSYLRDGNGRVKKVLRPAEKWTVYEYDGTGNVVKEEHYDSSIAAYSYTKDGLLSGAFNEDIHIKLQRDKAGRVIKEIQGNYEVTKKYDEDGNCLFTGSSLGAAIEMQYDANGLLQNIQSGGWQANFQRDKSGLELHRELSGGVSVKTERDQLGRVIRRSIGANNIEQDRTRYEWNKGYKLHKIVNELTGARTDFDYDAFDNLISATYGEKGQAETIYRVPDKIGNLFKTKDRSDRKYSKGGQLQQDEKYNYYYDGEGNLVFKEFRRNQNIHAVDKTEYVKEKNIVLRATATGWAYEWTANGMLQKVINPGGKVVTFNYDPFGRRVAKQFKDIVTRWVWDSNTPLHEWKYKGAFPPQTIIDEQGNINETKEPVEDLVTWVFEDNTFIPCAKIESEKKHGIITDYLGTPTHGYDNNGNLVWERELDCYGNIRKLKGETDFCNYLYQGQYIDKETGLAYNRFRYYDNESGNYISQDPIALVGGINLYSYVHDTNTYLDSSGLAPWERGGFGEWFNKATADEIRANKDAVSAALRGDGGMHEKFPVADADKAKELGFTHEELMDMTMERDGLKFKDVPKDGELLSGPHSTGAPLPKGESGRASSRFHTILSEKLRAAKTKKEALEIIKSMHDKHAHYH